MIRLMTRVDPAAEEARHGPEDGADHHREQGGEDRDQQRDAGAVHDPAEDVAAVDRLEPHQVVPADPAEVAARDAAERGVEQVLVELVRRVDRTT